MGLYKALNETEAMQARFDLLDEGEYDAIVKTSVQCPSKSGNIMADMHLTVYDKAGEPHEIRDFLVFSKKMLWKVKHFCDSAGLEKEYEQELFVPDMATGKRVRVQVGVQKGNEIPFDKLQNKPAGSLYPDKNVINDYIKSSFDAPIGKPQDAFIDDKLPF